MIRRAPFHCLETAISVSLALSFFSTRLLAAPPTATSHPPVLIEFVPAVYPAEETSRGRVVVELGLTITKDGRVEDVVVVTSGGEEFDEAAIEAARQFRFSPAEVQGQPVRAKITYRYTFAPPAASDENKPAAFPSSSNETAPLANANANANAKPIQPATEAAEVVVRGQRNPPEPTSVSVSATTARQVAGTQGDAAKVVQNLPGVNRSSLSSGQLVVWGSAPEETRIYVDGVPIPYLFHGSAIRTSILSEFVRSVDLVPGGYGADYGRGLGGLVRIETATIPNGWHGSVGADTLDARATASGEISSRVRASAGARYSYLDEVIGALSDTDMGDSVSIPKYQDYFAKTTLGLREGEAMSFVFLGARDARTRAVLSTDPTATRSDSATNEFYRLYARYSKSTEGGVAEVTPFVGYDERTQDLRFGAEPANLTTKTWNYGVRASYATPLSSAIQFRIGLDSLGTSSGVTRRGSFNIPPREGDISVFGQSPGGESASDHYRANVLNLAPNASLEVRLGDFTITPGIRYDAYVIDGSRKISQPVLTPPVGFTRLETGFDPRLHVTYAPRPDYRIVAAVGRYRQGPAAEDLGAIFGTTDLTLSQATHATLGQILQISRGLSLQVFGFHKSLKDLPVRSRLPTPRLARSLVQDGEGRVYGFQFLVRQEAWHGFSGWLSYTLSRSERRYYGEAEYRLFDYDQPHVLTLVGLQELGPYGLSARFRYATGMPRTPVVGSYYNAAGDSYEPIFGAQNSIRLPDFYQFDLRFQRRWSFHPVRVQAFVEVQNITFRKNVEEVAYNYDFSKRGYITGLPTLAIVGGSVEF